MKSLETIKRDEAAREVREHEPDISAWARGWLAHHDAEDIGAVVEADGTRWCAGGPDCRACWNFAKSAETYMTYPR